eukprot:gene5086-10179_t
MKPSLGLLRQNEKQEKMKRNSVKVCVRTRPTHHFAQDNIVIDQNESTIQVTNDNDTKDTLVNNKQNSFKFRFDQVFHNATQSDIYDTFARDTVQSAVDGINGAIMGIAPRAISQIFGEINSRIEFEYKISCSYMEIYNERIFDLLTDLSNPEQVGDYTIAEERDGRGVFVRGISDIEVTSEKEALNLLFSGELARTVATHKLNRRSNRSHSIFTVNLQQRQRSGISERVIHSKLHLVDLAGSERLKKTMDSIDGSTTADETIRKESMCINQSLTYLEQCVVALSRKGATHIPYRQSKLTNILKDCLGSNCNTLMIACVWGEVQHLEETISTLRLASRMMRVLNETSTIETIDPTALIKKQAKIIKALKQELSMHDALVERTGMSYEPYTPEMQSSVRQMILRYVDAPEISEEDILNIESYRQMIEICKQFKIMLITARNETTVAKEEYMNQLAEGYFHPLSRSMTTDHANASKGIGDLDSKLMDDYEHSGALVGDIDSKRSGGFALGVAPADSRPLSLENISRIAETKQSAMKQSAASPMGHGRGSRSPRLDIYQSKANFNTTTTGGGGGNGQIDSSGGSFEVFTRSEGSTLYAEFVDARSRMKDMRTRVKDGTNAVNDSKFNIDQLQDEIAARKASRIELLRGSGLKASETEDIVDEDEFKLMKELREAKRSYKNAYEQLQKDKALANQIQGVVEDTKNNLNASFSVWNSRRVMAASYSGGVGVGGGNGNGDGGKRWDNTDHMGSETSDQLDDQEAFDRLEMQKVLAKDPDSLAFFQAQKTRKAHLTQNGASIRAMHKNKRLA